MKKLLLATIIAIVFISGTIVGAMPFASASKVPGPPQIAKQLNHISKHLSHAADKLTKITSDPEPDDISAQARRFERVANILERAQERFDKISGDIPSGPNSDPAVITVLNNILAQSNVIADTALNFEQNPGPITDPAVLDVLNAIVTHANGIADTARGILCGSACIPLSPAGGSIAPCDNPIVGESCGVRFAPSFVYSWNIISIPTGSSTSLNNPSSTSPSFVPDSPGCYQVGVIITDSLGNTASTSKFIPVPVSNCGQSEPSVSGFIVPCDNPIVGESCGVRFAPSFVYSWNIISIPTGSSTSLNNPSSTSPSFVPDSPGCYQVGVIVTNTQGGTASLTTFIPIGVENCGH